MSLYPSDPRPRAPYTFRTNRPFATGGPAWAPQDRPLTRFGLGEVDLVYEALTWSEIKTLYDFFESIGGPGGRFTYADFNGIDEGGRAWAGLFVAKGDGITLAWDLPTYALVASPAPVVKENGSTKTNDIYTTSWDDTKAYHIKVGAGTDGVDLITAESCITTVATAPSPATSGTSLVVASGKGARFPTPPFYANVWPTAAPPTASNIETVQVTNVTTDTLTIVRAQNDTVARTIIVTDQIAVPPASTVLVTIDATCRRAFRRARFAAALNPFTFDVPEVYGCGPMTIAEVRR